jgi:hypothetical protein
MALYADTVGGPLHAGGQVTCLVRLHQNIAPLGDGLKLQAYELESAALEANHVLARASSPATR